jgi:hypothetical protein
MFDMLNVRMIRLGISLYFNSSQCHVCVLLQLIEGRLVLLDSQLSFWLAFALYAAQVRAGIGHVTLALLQQHRVRLLLVCSCGGLA